MKTANINYIHYLYYPLISMPDAEIDEFEINKKQDRTKLFQLMKNLLDTFGPNATESIYNCLEHIILTESHEEYWRYLLPHEVPLDEVDDKREYISELFTVLFQYSPSQPNNETATIVRELPPRGLSTKD